MPNGTTLAAADFTPAAVTLLVVAGGIAVVLAVYFAIRWTASFPDLPTPGPETSDLGPEPPAVANLLVNRCHVTSAAAAATLIDLAARKHLELFEVGPDHFAVRVRGDTGDADGLTRYEQRVMALVRERVTGGSAPLEAIELDESQAASWRSRFAKDVVDDAKARSLLRGRWTRVDWAVLAVLTAALLVAVAGALYLAHVEDKGDKSNQGFDRGTWFIVAFFAWLVVLGALHRLRSIRYSPSGESAAARWLGVKRYLQHDAQFGDTPPAGVAIWNRLLAYGAGLGVAHGAVAAIPLEEEDPGVAWSRVGGNWHQVHVEYPRHFGYGERPLHVFLNGAARAVFWGVIAFVVLPIVLDALWNVGSDALDSLSNAATFGVVAAFGAVFGVMAVYLLVRVADAVIRTYRGLFDLRRTVTVEGQVVKHHHAEGQSWFAVDPGNVDSVKACHPGDDGALPARGADVQMVLTPHLHHVVSVKVVS
ncbi:MAG TPA: hypothetical protein VEP49_09805 [Acidimicrobiia bacterium]|nr:hypothetical protein [Acidimicrobiia bacterium]